MCLSFFHISSCVCIKQHSVLICDLEVFFIVEFHTGATLAAVLVLYARHE